MDVHVTVVRVNGEVALDLMAVSREASIMDLKCQIPVGDVYGNEESEGMQLLYGVDDVDDHASLQTLLPLEETECILTLVKQRSVRWGHIEGAWFGNASYIPKVYSEDLGRDVYKLRGVCWFKAGGEIANLEDGCYNVALRIKKDGRIRFNTNLIMSLNGVAARRVRFSEEEWPEDKFRLLEIGLCYGPGAVTVCLQAEDCNDRGQGSKSGLLIDRLIALPC
mmetsp:Transcript_22950/g.42178  ORF Transcript_22950/g.42178 Transcript_22950/m.42178 type:complete len:222 (+) Transcript_22950:149-814(+)